jgi:hypothetical protein
MYALSVRTGFKYAPFDPRESKLNPLIVLTERELRAPVWKRILVAVMELIASELNAAFSKYTSPATKLLTLRVLMDANRAPKNPETLTVLAF